MFGGKSCPHQFCWKRLWLNPARVGVRCAWAKFKELNISYPTACGASYHIKGKIYTLYRTCVQCQSAWRVRSRWWRDGCVVLLKDRKLSVDFKSFGCRECERWGEAGQIELVWASSWSVGVWMIKGRPAGMWRWQRTQRWGVGVGAGRLGENVWMMTRKWLVYILNGQYLGIMWWDFIWANLEEMNVFKINDNDTWIYGLNFVSLMQHACFYWDVRFARPADISYQNSRTHFGITKSTDHMYVWSVPCSLTSSVPAMNTNKETEGTRCPAFIQLLLGLDSHHFHSNYHTRSSRLINIIKTTIIKL